MISLFCAEKSVEAERAYVPPSASRRSETMRLKTFNEYQASDIKTGDAVKFEDEADVPDLSYSYEGEVVGKVDNHPETLRVVLTSVQALEGGEITATSSDTTPKANDMQVINVSHVKSRYRPD
jgi:hypothetical protein